METIETKKRYGRRVTAFVLSLCLLVGSAFALSPSYSKVSMPDPYGIMPLSLDDSTSSRTLITSSAVLYGKTSSAYSSLAASSYSVSTGDYKLGTYLPSTPTSYSYLRVASGTYADVLCSVDISSAEFSFLVLSGGASFYFGATPVASVRAYPDTAQILVNGSPVGSSISCSNGSFTLADTEIELSSSVTSLGVRFTWSSTDTVSYNSGDYGTVSLYSCFTDNLYYTAIAEEAVDYTPYLNRIISWEQSIYSSITNLGSSLSDSLGSAIEQVATFLNPNVEGSVGESVNNLGSIFARDDDIQLRDDVDNTLKEVTTQFYDQTSTSSSSMTVETVQNVKGISDGMDAMFSSGYSVSDAFTEIAENDDFMSWFTAETAQALDSTGAAATVGDDDPYNMHYYYEQVNAIAERRGD